MLNFQAPKNRNFFTLLTLLIFASFSILTIAVLFAKPGWPHNHEESSFIIRTLIYAAHYNFYDFLPIYSSLDNNNFGSPFPAFYHKLFSYHTYWLIFTDFAQRHLWRNFIHRRTFYFNKRGLCYRFSSGWHSYGFHLVWTNHHNDFNTSWWLRHFDLCELF